MSGAGDLLLDWGNSRLKWALSGAGKLQSMNQCVVSQPLDQCFQRLWGDLAPPDRVVCVNVTGSRNIRALEQFVQSQWERPLKQVHTEAGNGRLINGYHQPGQLGADRWVAMLGAAARCQGAFMVIDAGTALTVDVVAADGRHLGGWILPGRALMNQALSQHTENLDPQLIDSAPALGHDTAACIAGGISAAQLGALELIQRSLPDDCSRFVCGGDSRWVCQYLEESDNQPDLVLQGLAVWLKTHERAE